MSGYDKAEGPPRNKSQKEGTVIFAIYFIAFIPETENWWMFRKHGRAEQRYNRFSIPKRGAYNLAEIISSGYAKVFKNEDYGNLGRLSASGFGKILLKVFRSHKPVYMDGRMCKGRLP